MADTPCPFETFSSLALPNIRAAFIQRAPGVEVLADRQIALDRLKSIHLSTMEKAGFAGMPLAQAEQVHSAHVRIVTKSTPFPVPDCDALVTTEAGLCLGIYVADCAAVYLADKYGRGIALAHSGRSVIWLVNNRDLIGRYGDAHPNLRLLFHVTNEELRRLYQTCRAAIMPALRDFHAAGQTTGLEAISCGAPVVMSQGRAATIFAGVPGVRVVADNTPGSWLAAIASLDVDPVPRGDLEASAEWVRAHTDPRSLSGCLGMLLGM